MTESAAARTLQRSADALLDVPSVRQVLALLDRDGEQARVVGGAIRNALLGLPPGDIDVTTTALPAVVIGRAKAAGLRALPTGVPHGTVTVLVDRVPVEVTTLREDVETDGRHAIVRFGRSFEADAQRRDFTMNALSLARDGSLFDTTGGVADLAAGRVRFIGEADRRIREDFLRVLRFFRFSAAYGLGPLDPEGLAAAVRHRDALAGLSRERIRAELLKLLVAPRAAAVLRTVEECGVWSGLVDAPCRHERLSRLVADDIARESVPDALLRLAALAVEGPADADRLRAGLRLSNEEHRRLLAASEARTGLQADDLPGPATLQALLFRAGRQAACDAVRLAQADAPAELRAEWDEALAGVLSGPEPRLPLGGQDVMARGVTSGRAVGAILKRLQAAWIRAGFPQDPASLAALLDDAIAAQRRDD